MIFGRTFDESARRFARKHEDFMRPRRVFVLFPRTLQDGRWVWLQRALRKRIPYVNGYSSGYFTEWHP